jgi:hypothetical protein
MGCKTSRVAHVSHLKGYSWSEDVLGCSREFSRRCSRPFGYSDYVCQGALSDDQASVHRCATNTK